MKSKSQDVSETASQIKGAIEKAAESTDVKEKEIRDYTLLSIAETLDEEAPVGLVQLFGDEEYIYGIMKGNFRGLNEGSLIKAVGGSKIASDCMTSVFLKKPETIDEEFLKSAKKLKEGEYDFREDGFVMCTTKEGVSRRFLNSNDRDYFSELYRNKEELELENICPRKRPVCFVLEDLKKSYRKGTTEVYNLELDEFIDFRQERFESGWNGEDLRRIEEVGEESKKYIDMPEEDSRKYSQGLVNEIVGQGKLKKDFPKGDAEKLVG